MKDLLKGKISAIVSTKMWADETAKNNELFRIPNYVILYQTRNGQRGGGICFFF